MILSKEEKYFQTTILQNELIKQLKFYIGELESERDEKDFQLKDLMLQLHNVTEEKYKLKRDLRKVKKDVKAHPYFIQNQNRLHNLQKKFEKIEKNYRALMQRYLNKGK
jgi:hypothetical protein